MVSTIFTTSTLSTLLPSVVDSFPTLPGLFVMFFAAMIAGFIDSIVGGGGLVQLPALMVFFPTMSPASALGTNKIAAITGTFTAMIIYFRQITFSKIWLAVFVLLAAVTAGLGAMLATWIDPAILRPVIIGAVVLVGLYVTFRPSFGKEKNNFSNQNNPQMYIHPRWKLLLTSLAVSVIGFYDGIFGPGTGMFLIIGFTALLGISFLASSAAAKAVNVGTNLGAIIIFGLSGQIYWGLALVMAVGNTIGATIGSHLVLRKGTGLIRGALLLIVVMLTIRLLWQQIA